MPAAGKLSPANKMILITVGNWPKAVDGQEFFTMALKIKIEALDGFRNPTHSRQMDEV